MFDGAFFKRIQDALGTAEEGDSLVNVARDAHRAEQQLAVFIDDAEGDTMKLSEAYNKLKRSMKR